MKTNTDIEPELISLRTKLTAEIQTDTEQIELLRKRISKNTTLLNAVKGSLGLIRPESKVRGYGSKLETVRNAIASIPTPKFTQDDVEDAIRQQLPTMEINRNRIRAVLWTLAKRKNGIRQFSKGNNHQPAVYEKVESAIRSRRTVEQDQEPA